MLTLVIGLIVLVIGFIKLLIGSYENITWPLTFIAIGLGGVFISLIALVIKYLFT